MSVADLRAKHDAEAVARQEEAVDLFERGRKAEAAGKTNVARIYYQMTARRATGATKAEVLARLDRLDAPAAGLSKLAQSGR